jgi:hypothetical protein
MNQFQEDINLPEGEKYKINNINISLGKTTIGTSGVYATVSAAITAGKYDLILISDVT